MVVLFLADGQVERHPEIASPVAPYLGGDRTIEICTPEEVDHFFACGILPNIGYDDPRKETAR